MDSKKEHKLDAVLNNITNTILNVADINGNRLESGQRVCFWDSRDMRLRIGKIVSAEARLSLDNLKSPKTDPEPDYYGSGYNPRSNEPYLQAKVVWRATVREISTSKTFVIMTPHYINVVEESVLIADHL